MENKFPKSDPRPVGVPVDVFLACFKAYLGRFDNLHVNVPETLKNKPFGDPKKDEKCTQNVVFQLCRWRNWRAKTHVFRLFCDGFGLFGHPIVPSRKHLGGVCIETCPSDNGCGENTGK